MAVDPVPYAAMVKRPRGSAEATAPQPVVGTCVKGIPHWDQIPRFPPISVPGARALAASDPEIKQTISAWMFSPFLPLHLDVIATIASTALLMGGKR